MVIGWLGRHWSFFYDEWGTILYRRSGGLDAFLAPHNGHLQAVLIAVYRILFATVGLGHYAPYQWTGIAFQLLCGGLLFAYARRFVAPELAVLLLVPVLFMGWAWEVLYWPNELEFVVPMAALIGALMLRDSALRFADGGVAALLTAAVASSGVGIAVAAGVALDTLLRRDPIRRLWAVAVPAALYATWFFAYRPGADTPASLRHLPGAVPHGDLGELGAQAANIGRLPGFILHVAEAASKGVFGLNPATGGGGIALALLVAGTGAIALTRRRLTPRLIALIGTLLIFWITIGIARAQALQPQSSRYIYPAGILIALMAIEVCARWRISTRVLIAAALTASGLLVLDVRELSREGDYAKLAFARERAELGSLERLRGRVPPSYRPDPQLLPGVTAGPYFAAIRALGSPVH